MNGKKGNVSHRCYAQLRAGEGDLEYILKKKKKEYILSIDNPSDIFLGHPQNPD